jgi:uncharacterized protein YdeI (YjbR/CyaY-like superfamily)
MREAMTSQPDPRRFATQRAFETWLRKNHASSDGVWLLIAKAGADRPTITYPEAVEVALCYGWIDGQKKSIDAHHWLQRFTPRRARSVWSKTNRAKAEALIQSGRMQPSGQRSIGPDPTGAGTPPTKGRELRSFRLTCRQRSTPSPKQAPSSPDWTTRTATPCCGAFRLR